MEFDFDAWAKLSRESPADFELQRRAALRKIIESAPAEHRQRLEGLQFKLDLERQRAGSALGACIKLNSLMWDGFLKLRKDLDAMANGTPEEVPSKASAEVISMQQFVVTRRAAAPGEK